MKQKATMLFTIKRLGALAVVCAVVGFSLAPAVSLAAPINHGDYSGATVDYLQVTEDTNTGDTQPLFGAPNVSGDSLDFDPVGFSASSSGGGVPDQTDGQLSFMIVAKDGQQINSISFSEAGDTSLARGVGSTDDAYTSVTSSIFIDIVEVNGAPINGINVVGAMTFSPSDGDYLLSTDGGGNITYNTEWTGSYHLDLSTVDGINGLVTKVNVNLDNVLTASSDTNSSAFIAKKDFDGVTITTNIPEPTTALLAVFGLLATACSRRRG